MTKRFVESVLTDDGGVNISHHLKDRRESRSRSGQCFSDSNAEPQNNRGVNFDY